MRPLNNQGQLVRTGTITTHKRATAQGSLLSNPILSKAQSKHVNKIAAQQYNCSRLCEQQGGTRSPGLMELTLELWKWCLNRGIYIQAVHLPGIQNCLADKESRTCIDPNDWKIHLNLIKPFLLDRDTDLFAMRLTHQLPRYVSWRPDPQAIAADAFSLNWATLKGYAFPPVQSNTTNFTQSNEGRSHHHPSGASVAGTDLVALATSTGNQLASSPAIYTGNTEEPCRPNNDTSNVPTLTSSRLDSFQRSCSTVGLPDHITRLLSASVCKSTSKTYDSLWRRWNGWCDRREIDPISASVNNVLTFLSEQFQNN